MDFCALPIVVQHNVMRRMDFRSFHKTAMTSKEVREVAKSCRDKYWPVMLDYSKDDRHYMWTDSYEIAGPINTLFLNNTIVTKLALRCPIPDDIDLRCQELIVQFDPEDLLPVLKRHKPIGKYTEVVACFKPQRELMEWMSESISFMWLGIDNFVPMIPLTEYIDLRVSKLSVVSTHHGRDPIDGVAEYVKLLIDQWLEGKREIKRPENFCYPLPDIAPLLQSYPSISGGQDQSYRIRRSNGDSMAVEIGREFVRLFRMTDQIFPA